MTDKEALAELNDLRGLADTGSLAVAKERVEKLYFAVLGKHLRRCRCKNILQDALLEIYTKLRKNDKKTMDPNKAKARLVNGVVIFWKGNHYTNSNLTDEVAREFLASFPQRKDWFATLPSATTAKAVTAEVAKMPKKPAEKTDKEVIVADKPTAPANKKTAKKRK